MEALTMTPKRTIEDLCRRSNEIAKEKGWYDGQPTDPRSFSLHAALVHSEISEALEDWRKHRKMNETYYEVHQHGYGTAPDMLICSAIELETRKQGSDFINAKPCGIPIEIADFVIRIAQRTANDGAKLEKEMELYTNVNYKEVGDGDIFSALHFCTSMAWACEPPMDKKWSVMFQGFSVPTTSLGWFGLALRTVFTFAKSHEIDLWAAIEEKEAFNRTRPSRHGGKKA